MRSYCGCAAWASLLLAACCVVCASSAEPSPPPQQVEVIGGRAGPQMWKVTRDGDHVVWILGTLQPLPQRLKWRSQAVESLLHELQEVIPYDFKLDAHIGPISGVRLYFRYRRIRTLANGATLQQVLPPQLYARFAALRERYGSGPRDLERLQPLFAGAELREEALEKSGLTLSADIQAEVTKLARRSGVRVHELELEVPDPGALLQEAGDLSMAAQLKCFEPMIAALESDLDTLKARADAWSRGDVETLRSMPVVDTEAACWDAVADAPRIRALGDQAHKEWLAAVADALDRNKASLAVQSVDRLLGPDGWLSELRASGYTIEGPEFTADN